MIVKRLRRCWAGGNKGRLRSLDTGRTTIAKERRCLGRQQGRLRSLRHRSNNDCSSWPGVWKWSVTKDNCGSATPIRTTIVKDAPRLGRAATTDACRSTRSEQHCKRLRRCLGRVGNKGRGASTPIRTTIVQRLRRCWKGRQQRTTAESATPNNSCSKDCAGVWGGSATTTSDLRHRSEQRLFKRLRRVWAGRDKDACGARHRLNNDCSKDCAGVWGGS